jgi:Holliday junction DNA helicase RuvA
VIGALRGVLARKEPPTILVDVHGVGYELEAPMSTLFRLPDVGQEVQLRTHLSVREDQHTLYGFATEAERKLFRDLLKVSGVGARMALTILSGISVEGFARCVQTEDKATLVRLPGVGRKTAERLIVEMRDRIEAQAAGAADAAGGVAAGPRAEAFNALVSLGYKPVEARKMLDAVPTSVQTTEDILRRVLKAAAP